MELRPGYTMTELGVLPEDWEVRTLGELGILIKGKGITRSEALSGVLPCIRYGEIYTHHNFVVKDFISFISRDVAEKSMRLKCGDILFTCSGETKEDIGKCVSFIFSIEAYAGGDIIILRNTSEDTVFLGYRLNAFDIVQQKSSLGQGDAVVHISQKALSSILVSFPKALPEQHAIAAALSDVDALLDAQERLIAKKRNIKLAAMQQLLTGKTRLPGFQQNGKYKQTELGLFPEDWCHTELNMIIANIIGGGTPRRANPQFWNGNIPWVTVKDFATFSPYRTQEYITKEGIRSSATNLIPAGTLLIATRMALGKSAIYAVDVAINQDLKALFFKDYIDTKFIFYWFLWQESNIQALGSGSTVKGISLNLLKKINICCPPSLDEQRAIVAVLSDMDAELAALEARRDKLRAVKQGMMRELLTGRTRLAGAGGRHGQ